MLLHYFVCHKTFKNDPVNLLRRSKNCFSIKISNPIYRKDVEDNPKVIYLDPELQMIIDYKDSLIEMDELYEYKTQLDKALSRAFKVTQKHVSRRFCGNLTGLNHQKPVINGMVDEILTQNARNTSETCLIVDTKLNSKPIQSDFNPNADTLFGSDPVSNPILVKRNVEFTPTFARTASVNEDEHNNRVKRETCHSTNKRVSHRCANLA